MTYYHLQRFCFNEALAWQLLRGGATGPAVVAAAAAAAESTSVAGATPARLCAALSSHTSLPNPTSTAALSPASLSLAPSTYTASSWSALPAPQQLQPQQPRATTTLKVQPMGLRSSITSTTATTAVSGQLAGTSDSSHSLLHFRHRHPVLPLCRAVSTHTPSGGGPGAQLGAAGNGVRGTGVAPQAAKLEAAQGVPQQQGQQGQRKPKQTQSDWDDESEPPPVPLDPNAEQPGMLFVTAGAALSALLAVGVATLGILGAFYAGYAISQVAKELRKTEPTTTTATTTEPHETQTQVVGRPAAASGRSSSSSGGSSGARSSKAAESSGVGSAAAVAAEGGSKRRSWWSWLGLGPRRGRQQEEREPQRGSTPTPA